MAYRGIPPIFSKSLVRSMDSGNICAIAESSASDQTNIKNVLGGHGGFLKSLIRKEKCREQLY